MQSTLDIGLSSARSRGQAARYARTRKTLNKEHESAQFEAQNQLDSKHGPIRFKPAISQNRPPSVQKVEILIPKQPALRHHLPQYTVDGRYVGNSDPYMDIDFKPQKLPDSALRPTYDVSTLGSSSVPWQHLCMTYWNQTVQWEERKRFLKALFVAEVKPWLRASKITRVRFPTMDDIKAKITNVPKPIVVRDSTNFIRHTDNMKLQQLWELCDLEDYEAIPEAMFRYLESRKNEILGIDRPEPPHSYQRFAIEPPGYYLRSANLR